MWLSCFKEVPWVWNGLFHSIPCYSELFTSLDCCFVAHQRKILLRCLIIGSTGHEVIRVKGHPLAHSFSLLLTCLWPLCRSKMAVFLLRTWCHVFFLCSIPKASLTIALQQGSTDTHRLPKILQNLFSNLFCKCCCLPVFVVKQTILNRQGNSTSNVSSKHEFHETCHTVTIYFLKKRIGTML